MPPILFPVSTSPGNDAIEGAGRLINCYAETLQEGAPGQYVRRRVPGLTVFCETSESSFRGMWYDGDSYIYAAWEGELFYIDSTGAETSVGALVGGSLTFLSSAVDTSNLTTYTYAAVALGAAHFNRRIVLAIYFNDPGDSPPASVTIGGVAATLVKNQNSLVAIYIALVPTGTTGDIVVQYATAATSSAIGVWRLDGADTSTPHHTAGATGAAGTASTSLNLPSGGSAVAAATIRTATTTVWGAALSEDYDSTVEASFTFSGASKSSAAAGAITVQATAGPSDIDIAAASWAAGGAGVSDIVTFAKNNATTPDQVLVTPTLGAFTFTTSAITVLDVNSEVPNSVCFGEGYFFFTTPGGLCYASGINATTVNALDVIRAEAKPEALVRGVFFDGELYLFGQTHTEVWASGGNPNPNGFPLNRTTVIWRGLVAPLAVVGMEDGFGGPLIWVADDNTVRMLQGYQAVNIAPPQLQRLIEACADKASIRCAVYQVDGHRCVSVDLSGETTWVYDLDEEKWHERESHEHGHWVLVGNTVKAFGKWIGGHHHNGNLYQIDPDAMDEDGDPLPFICESIAMESFPQNLQISRAEFNFVSGVGTSTVDDPEVKIQWSDDGGHRWKDPVTRKLGEAGNYKSKVRVNRGGLTGEKGRRYRLRIDDEVYVGLIGGSMDVQGLK